MSTEVQKQNPNRVLKIFLILVIILIMLGAGYALTLEIMRSGLVKGWREAAAKHGITQFPDKSAKTELEKLGFTDLNTLIKFSKTIDAGNYADALMMWKEVKVIATEKTDLGNIKDVAAILFPGT